MRSFDELKQLLRQIKNNDCNISDDLDINCIITDMLKFIGHLDSELRIQLIEEIFLKWFRNEILSTVQMRNILNVCIGEQHLFFGIGESNTDSVFIRAFSILIVPMVLSVHQKNAFLTENEVLKVKDAVLQYARQEKDFRGYVDDKGWAHAIAHAADGLGSIAKLGCVGREGLLEILDVIREMVANREGMYSYWEDERMVTSFMDIYNRKILADSDILDWLSNFRTKSWDGVFDVIKPPFDWHLKTNQKHFLRSLYFRLLSQEDAEAICDGIVDILQKSY